MVVTPYPALTVRTIGGIVDFFYLLPSLSEHAPTATASHPADVLARYWQMVTANEGGTMVPYWALGFHLCRWGYNSSANLSKVIKRNEAIQFPFVSSLLLYSPSSCYFRFIFSIFSRCIFSFCSGFSLSPIVNSKINNKHSLVAYIF